MSYDGITTINGVVTEVVGSDRPPQMLSDGSCGCKRTREDGEWVLRPCRKHGLELARGVR